MYFKRNACVVRRSVLLAGTAGLSLMLSQPANAQDGATEIASAAQEVQTLEDIVVTAQKREQSIIDVPASVTALSAESLIDRGVTNLQDYAAFVPGLAIGTGDGGTKVVIRGINTGGDASATSGVIVDGAPIGSSSSFLQGGSSAFDMNPADLQRVEVLKGPQGTLYGASTLGGLVSYVSRAPNLSTVSGLVGGEVAATEHGDPSYTIRGALNLPLIEDVLAVRVSAFNEFRGGFIDNGLTGESDINDAERFGGRVALRYEPSAALSINLAATYQKTERDAYDFVVFDADGSPRDGSLRYDEINPSLGDQEFFQFYGRADLDLGFADLTYIGSYQDIDTLNRINGSSASLAGTLRSLNFLLPLFGLPANAPDFPSPGGVVADTALALEKQTHEVRLSSNGQGPLQYTVGAFYTVEDAFQGQFVRGTDAAGVVVPTLDPALLLTLDSRFEEYAGFIDVTYDLTPRLQLGGGLRVGRNEQHYSQGSAGSTLVPLNAILSILYGPAAAFPVQSPESGSKEDVNVYSATARYELSDDVNVYGRFATGYRPGGPNTIAPGASPTFSSDEVETYEVGVKGRFNDGLLRVEAAAFYIDWSDIQVNRVVNGISSRDNGGKASSRGAEASITALPLDGLSLSATVAYTDAHLDEDVPEVGGLDGDPLPTTPEWSASLAGNYEWALGDDLQGFVDGSVRFMSERNTSFPGSTDQANIALDDYILADLRLGVRRDRFEVALFARNLTDTRARLAGRSSFQLNEVVITRPRTFGLSFTADF